MKNPNGENTGRANAHRQLNEVRTPQTRMSFLETARNESSRDSDRNSFFRSGEIFPESPMVRDMTGMHSGKGPRTYRRSDASIYDEVCRKLTDDIYIDATDIEVSVSGAEVILAGKVDSRETKHRAEDVVESVRGVLHFENRLRILEPEPDLRTRKKETFR